MSESTQEVAQAIEHLRQRHQRERWARHDEPGWVFRCSCGETWPCPVATLLDVLTRLQQEREVDSDRTIVAVGYGVVSAEGGMLWTDEAVNQIVANATRELRASLADATARAERLDTALRDQCEMLRDCARESQFSVNRNALLYAADRLDDALHPWTRR